MADKDCNAARGVQPRGRGYQLNYRILGKRQRKLVRGMSLDEAIALRNRLIAEGERLHPWHNHAKREHITTIRNAVWSNPHEWIAPYFRRLTTNAIKRGIAVEITSEDAAALLLESGGVCALTGVPFSGETYPEWRIAPYKPSLDRIDNALGYTITNCRWVCAAANVALNDYGEQVFRKLAVGYLKRLVELI